MTQTSAPSGPLGRASARGHHAFRATPVAARSGRRPAAWLTVCALALAGCGGGGGGGGDDGGATPALSQPTSADATPQTLDQRLEAALAAQGGKSAWTMPASTHLAAIPQDPRNPLTPEKIALGKLLYHDPATGQGGRQAAQTAGSYSCASCHHAAFGFQAGLRQGIGEGGRGLLARRMMDGFTLSNLDVQPIRTPSDMNAAYQRNMLWNGQFGAGGANVGTEARWTAGTPKATNALGYDGVEIQAIAGQGVHRIGAAPEAYKPMFDAAFPNIDVSARYDAERAGLAIAAYERTLLSNQAPWQLWLAGDTGAMTEAQKRGALLFLGKGNCAACHSGPTLNLTPANLSSRIPSFFALGFKDLGDPSGGAVIAADIATANKGRGGFTGIEADNHKFKVPQLYNLADSPFYGHGGSMTDLREVVVYLNKGVPENSGVPVSQLASEFRPLGLTDSEIDDLTTFLRSGLRDPDLRRYQPRTVLSGRCAISDDAQVRLEMGCP